MKLFRIGDIAIEKWQEGSGKDTVNHYYTECDCEHCVMGWDYMSYEGELYEFAGDEMCLECIKAILPVVKAHDY